MSRVWSPTASLPGGTRRGSGWPARSPSGAPTTLTFDGAVTYAVNLTTGAGVNPWGGTLTISNVENVTGVFDQNNDLTGNNADNSLRGGTKVDQLRGEGGNDKR